MDKSIVTELKRLSKQYGPEITAWRRHLHMHPEPSMQEHATAAFVVEHLREMGIEDIRTGVGETGVVALIRGRGKKTVGLRADMDALEMPEKNAVTYRSRRPGMMHACGHDGHTAALLGAAALLHGLRDRLPGQVKLIFQPGEEGAGGAVKMIRDGVLENPSLSALAALHVGMDYPAGTISVAAGAFTAQVDDIDIVISGRTAHAARPDQGVDAIAIAGQVLVALQQFVARSTNPLTPKVISIGLVQGGTRRNVAADQVTLIGTVRTLQAETREKVLTFLSRDLRKFVEALGGRVKVNVDRNYPPLVNDAHVAAVIEAAGADIVGKDRVLGRGGPILGGEDFAYFGEAGVPVAMFELGIRDEAKGFTAPGHNSRFDFDDARVLPLGAALLADTAFRMLEGPPGRK